MEEEMTRLIPSSLATALVAGQQRRIESLSADCLALLSAEALPEGAEIRLCVYRFEQADYQEHPIRSSRLVRTESMWGGVRSLFAVEDAEYSRLVLALCRDYARYVRLSGEDDLPTLVSYPQEEDGLFPSSLAQGEEEALRGLSFSVDAPFELAMSLDRPSLYKRFLQEEGQALFRSLLSEHALSGHALFNRPVQRVYLGCSFCNHRMPDRSLFTQLIERARAQRLEVTCVLSCLRPGEEARAEALIAQACAQQCEIMVSDWGTLQLCSRKTDRILLGPLLNRRRKDPRLRYQNGVGKRGTLLAQNSLNDPIWREYLQRLGVSRFEEESCGYPLSLPGGASHSLHLPWYQTNVSSYCPLCALLREGDRGKQTLVFSCDAPCEKMLLAYPQHLASYLSGASLQALSRQILATPEPLQELLEQGVDRLVVNWP